MSRNLIFSTMHYRPGLAAEWQSLLNAYREETGVQVSHSEFDWNSAWSEFMHMAIYGEGPDLSEFATSWVDDFAAMNALRPFSQAEIRQLGGADTFVPAVWNSVVTTEGEICAIPFLTEVRLVCYRRDLLAKAGVDEKTAFDTPEHFEQTLQSLQEAGAPIPWCSVMSRHNWNIHHLAMWLWHAGEDFIDIPTRTISLEKPAVRAAMRNYFRLYRYMPADLRRSPVKEILRVLTEGQAAVFISDLQQIVATMSDPSRAQTLGLAVPLGNSYLGGSNLVVWRWTKHIEDVLELISYLTSREFQAIFPQTAWMLSGRVDLLNTTPIPQLAAFQSVIEQALRTGRSLPKMRLWGLIEGRLRDGIAALLAELAASSDPDPDLDALLDRYIVPIGQRLQMTLSET